MEKLKILILGAGQGQVPLIKRAKLKGIYTIVATPQGIYPGIEIADECVFVDISDKIKILEISTNLKIDAIASDQTDISISTVQYVAQKLSLPCINCINIENFRQKSLMRDICSKNNIDTIKYCTTANLDECISFFDSLNKPKVIVKPIDSQGSRGITLVESVNGLADAFYFAKGYSKKGIVIIEEFINGQEIEVNSIIRDGEILATLVGDVHKFESENIFSSYERIYPTQIYKDKLDLIISTNSLILKSLGLITGWSHAEYIVSSLGKIYLIEVGARGGGNFVGSCVMKEMLGMGTDEMSLCTSLGDFSFYERINISNSVCACKSFYLPEGEIISINIDWQFLSSSFVLQHNLSNIRKGLKNSKNIDKTSRYTIVVKASNIYELRELLEQIEKHISIVLMTTSGTKGIIWL